jgi:hypothetical protein
MRAWYAILRALDLGDEKGNPSFAKLLTAASAGYFMAKGSLTFAVLCALISAAYGRSFWRTFLTRAQFKGEDIQTRQIQERRDYEQGIDPSP